MITSCNFPNNKPGNVLIVMSEDERNAEERIIRWVKNLMEVNKEHGKRHWTDTEAGLRIASQVHDEYKSYP